MLVAKRKKEGRNVTYQSIDFEKIHWRIKSMCCTPQILEFQKSERPDAYLMFSKLSPLYHANVDLITKKTIEGVYDKIPTTEIDRLSAEVAQEMCVSHPENSTLATRILVSNLQKNVTEIMSEIFPNDHLDVKTGLFEYSMLTLYMNLNKHGERSPLIAPYLAAIAFKYSEKINSIIDLTRDYTNHDYLGIKTLEKSYLFRVNSLENFSEKNFIVETPSIADMRIAISLVCAPIPCPNYYDQALNFISEHPEVIKEKYQGCKIFDWKDKRVNSKLFKKLYCEYMLGEAISKINVSNKDWSRIKNIYDGMSKGRFTPATPTRFAAGTLKPQGSSCFLIAMEEDSLSGIYNTLKEQSQISKHAGGVGIWAHNIRSTGSYIAGTNGNSNGLVPMLKVFDASSRYVDQGGKRPGTVVLYLEPWHADIISFVRLKRKKGSDADRARNLFYGLWIPDEFFRCWKEGKDWYLFDPAFCPKLYDSYDEKFSDTYLSDEYIQQNKKDFLFTYRYRKYIKQKKYESVINPELLMEEVVETVKQEGVPYFLAKDSCNRKSNQKNIGVIKSSNLCTEIIQYSDSEQTAVCNLHSICLSKFARKFQEKDNPRFKYDGSLTEDKEDWWTFDFDEFAKTVTVVQNNIDRLIDTNYYPTEKCRNSNFKTRAQGLGIQGEADLMALLKIPWNSKKANELRFYIFERMYYECLKASVELSKEKGSYEYFAGSPASQGLLQFDLWEREGKSISFKRSLPWDTLKQDIKKYGLRNSLFIAPMPTASTSDIMSNSPSIEPFNSLIYIRSAGAGNITVINKGLVNDLMSIGMWNKKMSDKILANHGSIKDIVEIPKKLRDAYLTVYDLEPSDIIDASFSRAWYCDQSQSMNLFFRNVTMSELSKAWTRGWKRGLKTLSYYCRTRPATTAQKAQIEKEVDGPVCSRDNPDCLSCGS